MIEEIRIYYESMEQGANYIKPIIERYVKKYGLDVVINLVKLKGSYSYYSKNVAPLIFWKDPDALVTVIDNDVEYPLLLIEFSSAVFTEDHELQRMDGLSVSTSRNCCYLKISSTKKESESGHGGNINFDYKTPYGLYLKKFGKISFHIEWPLIENKTTVLEADKRFLSCPPKLKELHELFEILFEYIKKKGFSEKWLEDFTKYISNYKDSKYIREWYDEIKKINEELLFSDSSRLSKENDTIILKLNRFGHAMDPERGMLSYYGTINNKTASKMLFDENNDAWYKDIPKEKEIKEYIEKNGLKRGYDFLHCFMLGSGLYNNKNFKELVSTLSKNEDDVLEIDLTEFLNKEHLNLNKPMRTIFNYSRYFFIVDGNDDMKVKLIWGKFNKLKDYAGLPNVTKIEERKRFDEDDVTYISVHDVLKPNGYKILVVSYPGAQGDRVVLIEAGTGRRQKRTYIDIISYIPNEFTALQEDKPTSALSGIQKDIDKLSPFKKNKDHQDALSKTLEKIGEKVEKIIKIGVGFWASKKFTIEKIQKLDIKDLDYFIYITNDRSEWVVWKTGKENMFKLTKGKVNLPKTYEVIKESDNKTTTKLEEFI